VSFGYISGFRNSVLLEECLKLRNFDRRSLKELLVTKDLVKYQSAAKKIAIATNTSIPIMAGIPNARIMAGTPTLIDKKILKKGGSLAASSSPCLFSLFSSKKKSCSLTPPKYRSLKSVDIDELHLGKLRGDSSISFINGASSCFLGNFRSRFSIKGFVSASSNSCIIVFLFSSPVASFYVECNQ